MVFGKKCLPNDFLKLKRKSNKEERFSRVPRLSDTRYSIMGPKGKGDVQASTEIEMEIYKQQSEIYGDMEATKRD